MLVALLGGTALGGVIAGQEGWLLGVGGVILTVIFIGSLGGFIYYATASDHGSRNTSSNEREI